MSRLVNHHKNCTTPEQSKQLLELGVPVRTADCFSRTDGGDIGIYQPLLPNNPESTIDKFIEYANSRYGRTYYIPCWSIGQLIKIMGICYDFVLAGGVSIQVYRTDIEKGSVLEALISDIAKNIHKMDFDKWRNGI